MDISEAIADGLHKKKMSCQDLATKLNVSEVAAWKWANGAAVPGGLKLLEIIRILDLVPALFPDYAKKQNAPSAETSLEARLAALEDRLSRPVAVTTENRSLIELLERRLAALEDSIRQHQATVNSINGHNVIGAVSGYGSINGNIEQKG